MTLRNISGGAGLRCPCWTAGLLTIRPRRRPRPAPPEGREQYRIALIEKIQESWSRSRRIQGQGGGSGIILHRRRLRHHLPTSPPPSAPTSIAARPPARCDDAVLVGLSITKGSGTHQVDPEERPRGQVPRSAVLGDSDKLKPGDMTLALGNPLLLATDFNPTVTFGMVSGVHRYQKIPHPSGTLLEWLRQRSRWTWPSTPATPAARCSTWTASGPASTSAGSLGKSDRINSGAAYSISVNMIKNFLGHLRSAWSATTPRSAPRSSRRTRKAASANWSSAARRQRFRRRGTPRPQFGRQAGGRSPAGPLTNTNQYQEQARRLPCWPGACRWSTGSETEPPRGADPAASAGRRTCRRTSRTDDARRRSAGHAATAAATPPAGLDASKLSRVAWSRLRQLLLQQAGAANVFWNAFRARRPATSAAFKGDGQ